MSRRQAEALIEIRLGDFGFPLCAGSAGYFVPECTEDLNHYLNSLRSRIICIALRVRTTRRAAVAAGWKLENNRFVAVPAQPDLPPLNPLVKT